ncbi:MAG TPA: M23 family metallopeptidase [Cellvibrio sp.]|nr:M23 family metallopeptidase [Cellvibrio sp.]
MRKSKKILFVLAVFLVLGFILPERIKIPVLGADKSDWNSKSFWFEPWGTSGVHKGIDIFAKKGRPAVSTTDGIVLYRGVIHKGGNVVLILGPKWRLHYFAHLDTIDTSLFSFVFSGERIGSVGDSGNAKGKPPHLHYSIVRLLPAPWAIDGSTQGYRKAFFINPDLYLSN